MFWRISEHSMCAHELAVSASFQLLNTSEPWRSSQLTNVCSALHEGHALNTTCSYIHGEEQVTIIPRTNGAGGFTLFTPSEERLESGLYSKRYLE
mmetsp:Transcript_23588/g.54610  ORF Transcript_23588/g.54610 Transcript_23588/m.54610 type:complete len:95 (+) Transcript_23588:1570-1854(+)